MHPYPRGAAEQPEARRRRHPSRPAGRGAYRASRARGRSSLAFDIVFAEGQRRFLESLSAFARQYIQVLDKPEVDLVSGMPPTIAIEQRLDERRAEVDRWRPSPRSTTTCACSTRSSAFPIASTATFPSAPQTEDQILADIESRFAGSRKCRVFTPLVRSRKGAHREILARAREPERRPEAPHRRPDRRDLESADPPTLRRARHRGPRWFEEAGSSRPRPEAGPAHRKRNSTRRGRGDEPRYYNVNRACPRCERSYEEPDPRLFSFNSRFGACPECDGTGSMEGFDEVPLAPNPMLSLLEGALDVLEKAPRRSPGSLRSRVRRLLRELGIDARRPFGRIAAEKRTALLSKPLRWLEPIYREGRGETIEHLSRFAPAAKKPAPPARCALQASPARSHRWTRVSTTCSPFTPGGALAFLDRFRQTEVSSGQSRGGDLDAHPEGARVAIETVPPSGPLVPFALATGDDPLRRAKRRAFASPAQLGSQPAEGSATCSTSPPSDSTRRPPPAARDAARARRCRELGRPRRARRRHHSERRPRHRPRPRRRTRGGRIVARERRPSLGESRLGDRRHLSRPRRRLRKPRPLARRGVSRGARARGEQPQKSRRAVSARAAHRGHRGVRLRARARWCRTCSTGGVYRALGGSHPHGEHDGIDGRRAAFARSRSRPDVRSGRRPGRFPPPTSASSTRSGSCSRRRPNRG